MLRKVRLFGLKGFKKKVGTKLFERICSNHNDPSWDRNNFKIIFQIISSLFFLSTELK